jgi:hypothetical protein
MDDEDTVQALQDCGRDLVAAQADADRLAKALRAGQIWGEGDKCWCPFDTIGTHEEQCDQARDALRQHEELLEP